MKKLFTLLALAGTLFAAAGCDDGKGNEGEQGDPSVITIDPDISKDQKILATDTKVTILFNATGDWKAGMIVTTPQATRMSLVQPLPVIEWAEIEGASGNKVETSGNDGNCAVIINFKPNTTTASRAVKLMIAGDSSSQETILITQLGTSAGLVDPDARQVKSIKETDTNDNPDHGTFVYITDFTYDKDGRVTNITEYEQDVDGTGTTYGFSYETGKVVLSVTSSSSDKTEYTATLGNGGHVTLVNKKGSDGNEPESIIVEYDGGYLKRSYVAEPLSQYEYTWMGGNLITQKTGEGDTTGDTYTYDLALSNANTNIDLNLFLNPMHSPIWYEDNIMSTLGYTGFMGRRSINLTKTHSVYLGSYSGKPDDPYYYVNELEMDPLAYTPDADGYVSKITSTYRIYKYKVDKETKDRTLEGTTNYTDVFDITYNEDKE